MLKSLGIYLSFSEVILYGNVTHHVFFLRDRTSEERRYLDDMWGQFEKLTKVLEEVLTIKLVSGTPRVVKRPNRGFKFR